MPARFHQPPVRQHKLPKMSSRAAALQMGWPSMRIPILVTMAWPQRLPCSEHFSPRLDFVKMGDLTFRAPDDAKYPAMKLAYSAGRAGGTMTGVLSAANEQVRQQCCGRVASEASFPPAGCPRGQP